MQFLITGIMMQHQTEVCELQCLLRNTQERLQIQIQTTVDQVRHVRNYALIYLRLFYVILLFPQAIATLLSHSFNPPWSNLEFEDSGKISILFQI